jgi:hypothetical protein
MQAGMAGVPPPLGEEPLPAPSRLTAPRLLRPTHALPLPAGLTMYVRTIVDVPHGTQLTVCHASQWDARPVRQAALLQVRAGGRAGPCGGRWRRLWQRPGSRQLL